MLTVVQLVFRVMRVTLGEWLGDRWVGFKNQHIASVTGMVVTMALVLSGTWVYLWQMFGASNQLMAALSLLLVTVWLRSVGKNPAYAGIPMVFMYVTTMAATIVTAYNLFVTIATPTRASRPSRLLGAWAMIAVAILLLGAAALIAWDAWQAWKPLRGANTDGRTGRVEPRRRRPRGSGRAAPARSRGPSTCQWDASSLASSRIGERRSCRDVGPRRGGRKWTSTWGATGCAP